MSDLIIFGLVIIYFIWSKGDIKKYDMQINVILGSVVPF